MELKDILTTLGIEGEINNVETFKEKFQEKFISLSEISERKDIVEPIISKAIGKRIGSLETIIKKAAKENGVDLDGEEIKGKPIEEVAKTVFTKLSENHSSVVNDLKSQLDSRSEDVIKKLNKEINDYKTKYNELETLLNDTKNQFTKLQEDKDKEIKMFKIEVEKKNIFDKVGFKKDMTAVEKTGFETLINSKYDLDLDEKGILIVKDKNGKRIKNDKVVGAFKTLEDILREEAEANGLISKNPHAGKQVYVNNAQPTINTTATITAANKMVFNPRFLRVKN